MWAKNEFWKYKCDRFCWTHFCQNDPLSVFHVLSPFHFLSSDFECSEHRTLAKCLHLCFHLPTDTVGQFSFCLHFHEEHRNAHRFLFEPWVCGNRSFVQIALSFWWHRFRGTRNRDRCNGALSGRPTELRSRGPSKQFPNALRNRSRRSCRRTPKLWKAVSVVWRELFVCCSH